MRLAMVMCLLLFTGTAAAGEIVPAAPTSADAVGYRYLASCSPPTEDHTVTVSGSNITIQEFLPTDPGGCRPAFTPYTVQLGRLAAGTYTLRYFDLEGQLVETIQFAVLPANVPTVGELGLAAIAAILALCGALLLRRA